MNELIDTWNIHNRINLYLLNAIPEEYLNDISASKGRTVREQFAHLHNVRLMWLKASAPVLLEGLTKLEKEHNPDKSLIAAEIQKSADAISVLFERSLESGKIKGFKPHATAFLGYLIAHESHHRGQIFLSLKQCGHPVDQKTQYGMWEWGSR